MLKTILIVTAFILLFCQTKLFAQRTVEQRVDTSVGNIEFVRLGDRSLMPNRWQIILGNKVLFDVPESYGTLRFEKLFKSFGEKEEVLFFSESMGGNAVSYILCVRAGLKSNSAEYLSPYLQDPEDIKKFSIEAIMKTVTYIEQMTSKSFRPRRPKEKTTTPKS